MGKVDFWVGISNGKFTLENDKSKLGIEKGVHIERFSPVEFRANGWNGYIDEPDGRICCICIWKDENAVKCSTKLSINKEAVVIIQRHGENKNITMYEPIEQWPVNGFVRLTGGKWEKRKASFRTSRVQHFMDDYGITYIVKKNPNITYEICNKNNDEGYLRQKILTDGKVLVLTKSVTNCMSDVESHAYERVANATWVAKIADSDNGVRKCILYTLEDAEKIPNLPNFIQDFSFD